MLERKVELLPLINKIMYLANENFRIIKNFTKMVEPYEIFIIILNIKMLKT